MSIANLSVVLDPSIVVVGGPLFAKGPALIDDVRRVVSRIVPTPGQIVTSTLGEDAPLLGSVLIATIDARDRLSRMLRQLDEPAPRRAAPAGPIRFPRARSA